MEGNVIICFYILALCYSAHSTHIKIFGADPAEGLWGALLNTSRSSVHNAKLLFHYRMAIFGEYVDVASYDEATRMVLYHTAFPSSLYYGPLCHDNHRPPSFLTDLSVVPLQDPDLGDCVNCETSAFAIHNGKIYFILYGEYFSIETVTRIVQIRVFEPCNYCGMTGEKPENVFQYRDIVECSRLAIDVINEQFSFLEFDAKEVKAGKVMKVVGAGDDLSFFFQLGNINRNDRTQDEVSMTLWHATNYGLLQQLHTETAPSRFSAWNQRALGSIDYHRGSLCWTTGVRLFCGDFIDNRLHNKVMLLTPTEVAKSGVCEGSNPEHNTVVSGVALTKVKDKDVVLFGCYPQTPNSGGTGVIYVTKSGHKHIHKISTTAGALYAGSVFTTELLNDACVFKPEAQICLGKRLPTAAVATTTPVEIETKEYLERELKPEYEDDEDNDEGGYERGDDDDIREQQTVSEDEMALNDEYIYSYNTHEIRPVASTGLVTTFDRLLLVSLIVLKSLYLNSFTSL